MKVNNWFGPLTDDQAYDLLNRLYEEAENGPLHQMLMAVLTGKERSEELGGDFLRLADSTYRGERDPEAA